MWNKKNIFTGWVDVPSTYDGIQEAFKAGEKISGFDFDTVYVSTLNRSLETAMIALSVNKSGKVPVLNHNESGRQSDWSRIYNKKAENDSIPVYQDWHLNERYYGELQGKNKKETAEQYGEDQVHTWRRSYDVPPPGGEALIHTAQRTIPFFKENIVPLLSSGKNILISAHGNSLRSIVMFLDNLTKDQVLKLEIATGEPLLYDYIDGKFSKGKL